MAKNAEEWERVRAIIERRRPGYVESGEREITQRGPLAFSDLTDPGRRGKVKTKYAESSTLWWHWSDGKGVLESLFEVGRMAVGGRRRFERLYDLAERVIPEEILALPTPSEEDARRALEGIAAGALGVATVRDLADYFRLPVAETRARAPPREARRPAWRSGRSDPESRRHSLPSACLDLLPRIGKIQQVNLML